MALGAVVALAGFAAVALNRWPGLAATFEPRIVSHGVTHDTHFEIVGINRRWDWNFDNEAGGALDTFIISSDGDGAYYDFRGVEGANTSTGPREFLQCVEG